MSGGIPEKPAALLVQLRTPAGQWVDAGHVCHLRERSWFQALDSYWDAVPRPVLGQIFEERGPAWRPSQAVTLPTWFSRPDYQGVPEAEFAALELARAAGIAMPEAFLVDVKEIAGLPDWATAPGGRALAVRRFDRTQGDGRVHVEQLAQILDIPTGLPRAKYVRANFETIASVVSALCGPGSVGEVIDRLVLNVLVGNGDAHLKNWAVCYPDGHQAVLSPAFDIVPTVLFLTEDDLGLKLNESRSFHDVTARSFDRLARRSGWTEQGARARVREAVERVAGAWAVLADHLPADSLRRLVRHRDALPLVRGG
jgi:serine/threonine-protein kinase HipA